MTKDQRSNLLLDLIDVRDALPARVLSSPKDNEGTDFTIIDCLFAVALGLCLTMLALSWFDVLTY